jgi:transcription elongation GreA/GreB family factor
MGDDDRELVQHLFAASMARIEAAHDAATAGQSSEVAAGDHVALARRLQAAARDIAALAEAARVIAADRPDDVSFDRIENSS